MGNGAAEEFIMPMLEKNGYYYPVCMKMLHYSRGVTEYLPCRYPMTVNSCMGWYNLQYCIRAI